MGFYAASGSVSSGLDYIIWAMATTLQLEWQLRRLSESARAGMQHPGREQSPVKQTVLSRSCR